MLRLFFAAAILSASFGLPAVVAAKTFSLEDARTIVSVSRPQISPDGSRIAYIRTHQDYKLDRPVSELVLVNVAGGAPRTLTRDRDGVSQPQWSPSGDRVAFLAVPAKGKPPQLSVMRMDGGDAQVVTTAKMGVGTYVWRPDGSGLMFTSDDERPDAAAADKKNDTFEVTDEHFLTREPSEPAHLWSVNADGSGQKELTSGASSVSKSDASLAVSPDGSAVYYERQPDGVFGHFDRATPVRYTFPGGAETPVIGDKPAASIHVSHNGALVAVQEPRHGSVYLQTDLVIRDAATGAVKVDARGIDRNVKWYAFAPDDATLDVGTSDGVRNVLWQQPVTGGAPRRVDLGDVDFGPDATIAKNGTIAFLGQTKIRPPEIYVLAAGSHAPARVTDENAAFATAFTWGKTERIDWTTDDGLAACGALTYPPDAVAGKKYPLVVIIHGGPVSTSTQNWGVLGQAMAARGFLVFQPNYRGSDNMGDAFLQAIVGHVTSGPGRDNLLGVEAVKKLGIVDEARMGVSGWSGGGLQTSWIIGHTHEFKAAVSGAAVNDWYEQATLADIGEDFAAAFIPGPSPFTLEGRAAYRAESPITFANSVTTPTLILSDTGDQRVPVTQAYAFYHALKDRGTTVEFAAYPRSGHFPTDPVGIESVYRRWIGWFTRWLQ